MPSLLDRLLYLFAPIALFVAAIPAHAALLVSYTDPTVWAAATGGIISIGFEGLATANSFKTYNTSTGLVISGTGVCQQSDTNCVQFIGNLSSSGYDLQVVNPGSTSTYYDFGSRAGLKGPNNTVVAGYVPKVHVNLPANTSAFAVDLMTLNPNGLTFQIILGDMTFYVATGNIPTRTFFGITSDGSITSVDFVVGGSGGSSGLMDNFRYGAAAADPTPQTPEVSTMLLIGSGLLGLGMLRKSRTRQHAAAA